MHHQRRRRAGQTGDKRTAAAAITRLRSGLAIADERARLLQDAIGAMCRACEPEGVCRDEDCPLRPFSPLPVELHVLRAEPRTEFEVRSQARRRPEAMARQSAAMRAWHADPANRGRRSDQLRAAHARKTPEERDAWIERIRATKAARRAVSA
jgi:hypothetical protein